MGLKNNNNNWINKILERFLYVCMAFRQNGSTLLCAEKNRQTSIGKEGFWTTATPRNPLDNVSRTCLFRYLGTWLGLHASGNRPFAQLWPGNEVRGIVGENRLRCVRFSFELSFFFCFGMSFSDHCGVPRCSNRGRASPLVFSHSFPWSSELRKRWLFASRLG